MIIILSKQVVVILKDISMVAYALIFVWNIYVRMCTLLQASLCYVTVRLPPL